MKQVESEVIRWRELWRAKRALLGGSGGMPPRIILTFRHAEIASSNLGVILQE